MGRKQTAYFAFSDAYRGTIRAELNALKWQKEDKEQEEKQSEPQQSGVAGGAEKAGVEGEKQRPGVGVADVAKELGRRWKELTEAERDQWRAKALETNEEMEKEEAEKRKRDNDVDGGEKVEEEEGAPKKKQAPGLPTARVKRIITSDKDINRISKEALLRMTSETERFVASLARESGAVAKSVRRKTLRVEDLEVAVRRHNRFKFLREHLSNIRPPHAATTNSENAKKTTSATTAKDKGKKPSVGRTISSFFNSVPVAPVEGTPVKPVEMEIDAPLEEMPSPSL